MSTRGSLRAAAAVSQSGRESQISVAENRWYPRVEGYLLQALGKVTDG